GAATSDEWLKNEDGQPEEPRPSTLQGRCRLRPGVEEPVLQHPACSSRERIPLSLASEVDSPKGRARCVVPLPQRRSWVSSRCRGRRQPLKGQNPVQLRSSSTSTVRATGVLQL